jgi:hypothetical protein
MLIKFCTKYLPQILLGIADGTDEDSTQLWMAAFVLEHIIIFLLVWFLFSVPNEPKSSENQNTNLIPTPPFPLASLAHSLTYPFIHTFSVFSFHQLYSLANFLSRSVVHFLHPSTAC